MAQYDGSIRIGTGIDEKGFKAGSKELEAGARSLAKSVSDSLGEGAKIALQKQTDAFVKLNQQYAAQEKKVKDIAAKLHDVQRQRIETAEFKELSKDLDKAKASLDRLYDRRDSYVELGKKVPPKLDLDISDAERKIRLLEGDIKELQLTNKAYIPADTGKVQQELAMAEQKQMQMYTALQTAADSLSQKTSERVEKEEAVREKIAAEAAEEERLDQIRVNAVATNDQIIAKVERLKQLEKEIADLKAAGTTEGYADYDNRIIEADQLKQDIRDYRDSLSEVPEKFSRMREAAKKAFNAISTGLSTIGKIGKKAFSGIFSIAKKMFSSITSGTKKSNGLFSTFASRLKGIALSLLIFNWISKGFNAMISGMKKGFENFMGYSDSYAQSVQNMKNAMSTLGNQIAAAFAPIVQMVIPWLNSLISTLSTAMTYIAQFIAALTGKSTFTKATQIQDKYNKSLGGTAKAADKARGALAKFDDLDVLEKKQEDTSGGGGAAVTDPSDMFEEEKVSDKWKNIADWFRQMWENSDFYELGKLLGEKLKEALESIPWDEIKETARKIGTSLATLINGFIEVEGLGFTIGNTLAQAFNTGFEFLNAFIHELHWDSIGIFIADTINGFFNGLDWELIYDTFITGAKGLGDAINSFVNELDWEAISDSVSNFINTFVDTIYTFITTVNWAELGENLGKAISDAWAGIDWAKAGETVGESFKAFFDFISNVIENIDWYAVGESVREFLCGIDWAGVAASFFEFVGAAFGGFASFLIGLFGESFVTGSAMSGDALREAAQMLFYGFSEGIINAFASIGEFVKSNIFEPFMQGIRNAFGIHSPSTVMAEIGGYLIEGLKNGILGAFESLKETIGGVASGVVEKFKDILGIHSPSTVMEENGMYMVDGLKNGIESTIDSVYALFNPDTWTEIGTQMFNALMETVTLFREMWTETFALWQEENTELYFGYDIWYEQWENMLLAYNDVNSEFMSEWQNNITNWWNTMVMPYFTVLQWKTFGDNMRNGIMQGFKAIVNNIAGVLNQVIQLFNSAYKQLQDSMNSLIDDYNAKAAIMGTSTLSHVSYKAMQSIKVPALASGAVIRGGNPFLAILGDQPARQTNIETPLPTMVDAFKQAIAEMGGIKSSERVPVNINVNYDNETFMRIAIPDLLSELGRQGFNVDVLEVNG